MHGGGDDPPQEKSPVNFQEEEQEEGDKAKRGHSDEDKGRVTKNEQTVEKID